jgi:hypothetical protein
VARGQDELKVSRGCFVFRTTNETTLNTAFLVLLSREYVSGSHVTPVCKFTSADVKLGVCTSKVSGRRELC